MELKHYGQLPEKEQWNVLWLNAKFTRTYETELSRFVVYAVYNFFIEVEINLAATRDIIGKKIFSSSEEVEVHINNRNRVVHPWEA